MTRPAKPGLTLKIAAAVAMIFGLLTIFSGGMALFGGAEMGNTLGFVLRFNFLAGFAYVVAGMGLALKRPWGRVACGRDSGRISSRAGGVRAACGPGRCP